MSQAALPTTRESILRQVDPDDCLEFGDFSDDSSDNYPTDYNFYHIDCEMPWDIDDLSDEHAAPELGQETASSWRTDGKS